MKIQLEKNHVPKRQWPHEKVNQLIASSSFSTERVRKWVINAPVVHTEEMGCCPW